MSTAPNFHLGQAVLFFEGRRRESRQVEISRVGRTNVGVQMYGRERVFNARTGLDARHRIGDPDRIATPEMLAEEKRHADLVEQLRRLGIITYGGFRDWSAGTLGEVYRLLDENRIPRT